MSKHLRIALWNANGLLKYRDKVKSFLEHNLIDIFLISETHFTDKSYFNIPQFKIYYTNYPSNRARGGTAILTRINISHYEFPKFQKDFLQGTIIKVKLKPKHKELSIAAVYCPPRNNLKKENFQEFFEMLGSKFIAGGDFNSKHILWGSRTITIRGKELNRLVEEKNYSFLSTHNFTYWPINSKKNPDLLDFFIIKEIPMKYLNVVSNKDLSSDHSPIITSVGIEVIRNETIN